MIVFEVFFQLNNAIIPLLIKSNETRNNSLLLGFLCEKLQPVIQRTRTKYRKVKRKEK